MIYLPTCTIKIIYTPYNMDPMGYAAMALRFHQAPPQAP